ncbi:hypothetical protein KIN20_031601 [Parelaphostrongylus tenuis]|uniref:Helix-turn-helix domain-containing protein n=1 Tax=Parelaphostrongylus tenuis TaxID=148309 RepID=A0AAD5R5S2_PARTN|nr:hypothetical protein KIN20_031601 [Parelaphostrongylus tenuis]
MTKCHFKPSNQIMLVHHLSSHPSPLKKTLIKNMYHTASNVCTRGEKRKESLNLALQIAIFNGYDYDELATKVKYDNAHRTSSRSVVHST